MSKHWNSYSGKFDGRAAEAVFSFEASVNILHRVLARNDGISARDINLLAFVLFQGMLNLISNEQTLTDKRCEWTCLVYERDS